MRRRCVRAGSILGLPLPPRPRPGPGDAARQSGVFRTRLRSASGSGASQRPENNGGRSERFRDAEQPGRAPAAQTALPGFRPARIGSGRQSLSRGDFGVYRQPTRRATFGAHAATGSEPERRVNPKIQNSSVMSPFDTAVKTPRAKFNFLSFYLLV